MTVVCDDDDDDDDDNDDDDDDGDDDDDDDGDDDDNDGDKHAIEMASVCHYKHTCIDRTPERGHNVNLYVNASFWNPRHWECRRPPITTFITNYYSLIC